MARTVFYPVVSATIEVNKWGTAALAAATYSRILRVCPVGDAVYCKIDGAATTADMYIANGAEVFISLPAGETANFLADVEDKAKVYVTEVVFAG